MILDYDHDQRPTMMLTVTMMLIIGYSYDENCNGKYACACASDSELAFAMMTSLWLIPVLVLLFSTLISVCYVLGVVCSQGQSQCSKGRPETYRATRGPPAAASGLRPASHGAPPRQQKVSGIPLEGSALF